MFLAWKTASQNRQVASFRYRAEQPMRWLGDAGWAVEFCDEDRLSAYDAVVFSKSYGAADLRLAESVRAGGARVIFDLCDNHFYNPFGLETYKDAAARLRIMIGLSDQVICSTPGLAEEVSQRTGVISTVIGDVVERLPPVARPPANGVLHLLWFGSHGSPNAQSGMSDLLLIADDLKKLAAEGPLHLTVVSNNEEKYRRLIAPLPVPTSYVPWGDDVLVRALAKADGVVIPISHNRFNECKTHNRLTLSLAVGVPVLATGIESYLEFSEYCILDNWAAGLRRLRDEPESLRQMAAASRPHLQRRWGEASLARQWRTALSTPQPTTISEADGYQGQVEPRLTNTVRGWTRSFDQSSQPLQVCLFYKGTLIGSATADEPRDDLRRAGLDEPDCGFTIPAPDYGDLTPADFEVRTADAGWLVGRPLVKASRGWSS